MESESGENVEYFWMLRKPLLVLFCGVGIVQCVFSFLYDVIWCLQSATPRNYQNILLSYPPEKKNENYTAFFVTDLKKRKCPTKNQRNNLVEVWFISNAFSYSRS